MTAVKKHGNQTPSTQSSARLPTQDHTSASPAAKERFPLEQKSRIRSANDAAATFRIRGVFEEWQTRHDAFEAIKPEEFIFYSPPAFGHSRAPPTACCDRGHADFELNVGPYALTWDHRPNVTVLELEQWLLESLNRLDSISACDRPVVLAEKQNVISVLQSDLRHLECMKAEEWGRRLTEQAEARRRFKLPLVTVVDTGTHKLLLVFERRK